MTLSEYLSEAVAKRKTGKYGDGFPDIVDIDTEAEFLESKGLKRITRNNVSGTMLSYMLSRKENIYYTYVAENIGEYNLYIRFAHLPIVFVHQHDMGQSTKSMAGRYDYFGYVSGGGLWKEIKDFKEFRDEIVEEIEKMNI